MGVFRYTLEVLCVHRMADSLAKARLCRFQRPQTRKRRDRLCAARDERRRAHAPVIVNKDGAPAMAQIVKRPAPRPAGAEARLCNQRFFAHRVDEAVAAQRARSRKGQRPAAL